MSAFFMLVLLSTSTSYALEDCRPSPTSTLETAIVKWVYDGDTLLVTDQSGNNKRKIRIIGIDTPEVKHHQQKAQLYGAKAREELRVILKEHDYRVSLEFDKEKFDRYKRQLAYVYLPDGTSISEWLLKRGYAKTLIFPPNVKYANCYREIERYAQDSRLKLWKLKSNQLKSATEIKPRSKGHIRLKGKIVSFRQSKKTIFLELENSADSKNKPIQLKIRKKNLPYFKDIDLPKLVNKKVFISGILRNKKGKRTIFLNHSTQLELMANKN